MAASHEITPSITADVLATALGISHTTLWDWLKKGKIPTYADMPALQSNRRLWTLPTIRRWRPDVADRIEHLLKMPPLKTAA